jgi:hypothetical protein
MYRAESRATQRSRWYLRAQPVTVARHEDSACSLEAYRLLLLTVPLKVVQLTSLRPAADQFCALLSTALKAELLAGKMKTVKPFSKTCYSENLVLDSSPVADNEREDGSLIDGGEKTGEGHTPAFHGGLGLRFKFPGDPKKYVLRLLLDNKLTLSQASRGVQNEAMDELFQG